MRAFGSVARQKFMMSQSTLLGLVLGVAFLLGSVQCDANETTTAAVSGGNSGQSDDEQNNKRPGPKRDMNKCRSDVTACSRGNCFN